jgi:hypothetical protein
MSAPELVELIQYAAELAVDQVGLAAGVNEALKMVGDDEYDMAVISLFPNTITPQEARKKFVEKRVLVWK